MFAEIPSFSVYDCYVMGIIQKINRILSIINRSPPLDNWFVPQYWIAVQYINSVVLVKTFLHTAVLLCAIVMLTQFSLQRGVFFAVTQSLAPCIVYTFFPLYRLQKIAFSMKVLRTTSVVLMFSSKNGLKWPLQVLIRPIFYLWRSTMSRIHSTVVCCSIDTQPHRSRWGSVILICNGKL